MKLFCKDLISSLSRAASIKSRSLAAASMDFLDLRIFFYFLFTQKRFGFGGFDYLTLVHRLPPNFGLHCPKTY